MVFCGEVATVESDRTGGVLKAPYLRGLPAGQVILTERSQEGLLGKQGPQGEGAVVPGGASSFPGGGVMLDSSLRWGLLI